MESGGDSIRARDHPSEGGGGQPGRGVFCAVVVVHLTLFSAMAGQRPQSTRRTTRSSTATNTANGKIMVEQDWEQLWLLRVHKRMIFKEFKENRCRTVHKHIILNAKFIELDFSISARLNLVLRKQHDCCHIHCQEWVSRFQEWVLTKNLKHTTRPQQDC